MPSIAAAPARSRRSPSTARGRGILGLLAAAAAVLALTACGSLPTDGQVYQGLPVVDSLTEPEFAFAPAGPQPGATPTEIVDGFLRAGTGAAGDWERAREFLAPSIRNTWNPDASVTVDLGERVLVSPTESQVTADLVRVGTVDDTGAYSPDDETTTRLSFRLGQQDDGEWRITEAPDGVVLARNVFPRVFHRYSIMYFDPTWTYLVPDLRWFPSGNAPTRIAGALLDGSPSPWLAASVRTAAPEGVFLDPAAVPVSSGVASVGLSSEAQALDPETLGRIQTQLDESLRTANITSVQLSVADRTLVPDAAAFRSTGVVSQALVLTEDGFGLVTGGELAPLEDLSPVVVAAQPIAIQVSADRDTAAALLPDGSVARLDPVRGVVPTDTRQGLVAPTVDPFGYIWSVPAGDPSQVQAVGPDDSVVAIADAFAGATQVQAMSLSRDGTRLAASVNAGGRGEIWVAGVVRNADGVPERLGVSELLGTLPGPGTSLAWLDDATVGVLAAGPGGPTLTEQTVGGAQATTDAPAGVASIAGVNTPSTVRLHTSDGLVYTRRGAGWTQSLADVLVLATQQGRPN
ncbi:LpqB family beta-propeller domain-containing protein [Microbacterium sp. BWT-B31]|uniref:LpqB family beta-propeller domain-containing protein n=1 Tax=Microbacterium sp. BWT-B31 TaxID=3232072 RepID=UPI0035277AD9